MLQGLGVKMTTEEKKQFCGGCYNEFYNHGGVNGNTKECWGLKTAKKVKRKQVHINDVPPWKHQKIVEINSCYRKPQFVYVDPKATC